MVGIFWIMVDIIIKKRVHLAHFCQNFGPIKLPFASINVGVFKKFGSVTFRFQKYLFLIP
jgi:hypothetical protein